LDVWLHNLQRFLLDLIAQKLDSLVFLSRRGTVGMSLKTRAWGYKKSLGTESLSTGLF
jgi:hypothetical protein